MPQIYLRDITKQFKVYERKKRGILHGAFFRETKTVTALDRIGFEMDAGELVGYIGPNGAGKSTTVKVMSGILTPEAGACEIMGRVPWKDRVRHVSEIGVVFGQRSQLWWDVPVSDSYEILRHIYRIPAAKYQERLQELLDALDAGALLKTPVRQLSLGQRMRCEIVASLLHSPRILFLDEPTIGLDAVSKLALRQFLREENRRNGITMVLTTHDMDDIEALCERVMVIGHGKLLFDGPLTSLKREYAPLRRIRATLAERAEDAAQMKEFAIPGAESVTMNGPALTILFDPVRIQAHEMVAELSRRFPLKDIMIEEQDIDEIIARMYRAMEL